MSHTFRATLSLKRPDKPVEIVSVPSPALPIIDPPTDRDGTTLILVRAQLEEAVHQRQALADELVKVQETITEIESGTVDSRIMPRRRLLRDLRDKLALLDRRIERQVDDVRQAQNHQTDWFAMRERAHHSWGLAVAKDYLAGGVDAARWRDEISTTFLNDPENLELALRGFDHLCDNDFDDSVVLAQIYTLWGRTVEGAVRNVKLLPEDLIDLLKQHLTNDTRRDSIIAVHQFIEHSPPSEAAAEEALYTPAA